MAGEFSSGTRSRMFECRRHVVDVKAHQPMAPDDLRPLTRRPDDVLEHVKGTVVIQTELRRDPHQIIEQIYLDHLSDRLPSRRRHYLRFQFITDSIMRSLLQMSVGEPSAAGRVLHSSRRSSLGLPLLLIAQIGSAGLRLPHGAPWTAQQNRSAPITGSP